jgi:hypothetical protein
MDSSIPGNGAGGWYKMFRSGILSAVSAKHHSRVTGKGLVASENRTETSYLLNDLFPGLHFVTSQRGFKGFLEISIRKVL